MAAGIITVSYIGAAILFILSLAGLSQQETARRGNIYGVTGMVIAIIATIVGLQTGNFAVLLPAVIETSKAVRRRRPDAGTLPVDRAVVPVRARSGA